MIHRLATVASVVALAGVFTLTACKHSESSQAPAAKNKVMMGAMNDKCPISGHAVDKSVKTASFEGHPIGFCCGDCQSKWDAMSTAEKEAWVAKNMKH